jgi:hypothetical protein
MPRPDPLSDRDMQAVDAWMRYRRMMKWMALASLAAALLALLYLRLSGVPMHLHMVIATLAGVGLSVLVGTGLMGLVFLSSRSGHDEGASGRSDGR